MGAHARSRPDGRLELTGWVGLPDGSAWLVDDVIGGATEVGDACAQRMLAAGARGLLDEAHRLLTV